MELENAFTWLLEDLCSQFDIRCRHLDAILHLSITYPTGYKRYRVDFLGSEGHLRGPRSDLPTIAGSPQREPRRW